MKAIQVEQFGGPEALIYRTVPDLTPGAGQILVKVESASVNYADIMRRSNAAYPFPTRLPFIPGSEVAGTVEALGAGVDGPPVGTPVFALVGQDGSSGYAQYALASAPQVIPIPPGLSADEACGIAVAGLAAYLMLKTVAELRPGEAVLVPGAAGGLGQYAIQIARLLGAGTVIGTVGSRDKLDAARRAGADHVLDVNEADWPEQARALTGGRGVDVLLEMHGGQTFAQGLRCLAPFGRLVVYGMAGREPLRFAEDDIMRFFYNPSLNQSLRVFNLGLWFGLRPAESVAALGELIGLAASGQVKIPVGHVLPLAQAAEAHRLIEARRNIGKVILKPWIEA
jgi:NADPH:quinone reductase-like Zn-dependent oxidoreductase